jgi:hypothetical protein
MSEIKNDPFICSSIKQIVSCTHDATDDVYVLYAEDTPSKAVGFNRTTSLDAGFIGTSALFSKPLPKPSVLSRAPVFHIKEEEISWLQCAVLRMEAERHQVNCELSTLIQALMMKMGPLEPEEEEFESNRRQTCLMMMHSSSLYDDFLMGHTKYFCQEIEDRSLHYDRIEEENRFLNQRLQAQEEAEKQREGAYVLEKETQKQRHEALLLEIADLTAQLTEERIKAEKAATTSSATLVVLTLMTSDHMLCNASLPSPASFLRCRYLVMLM